MQIWRLYLHQTDDQLQKSEEINTWLASSSPCSSYGRAAWSITRGISSQATRQSSRNTSKTKNVDISRCYSCSRGLWFSWSNHINVQTIWNYCARQTFAQGKRCKFLFWHPLYQYISLMLRNIEIMLWNGGIILCFSKTKSKCHIYPNSNLFWPRWNLLFKSFSECIELLYLFVLYIHENPSISAVYLWKISLKYQQIQSIIHFQSPFHRKRVSNRINHYNSSWDIIIRPLSGLSSTSRSP